MPSADLSTSRKPDLRRPVPKIRDMPQQLAALDSEPVPRSPFMINQARRSQLPQLLGKHAGGHVRRSGGQLPVCQPTDAQLPKHSQSPPPAEHIEQRKHRGVGHLVCSSSCHVRHTSSLTARATPGNTVAARPPRPHSQSNALISDAKSETIIASDSDASQMSVMHIRERRCR